MAKAEYLDVTEDQSRSHNASSQDHVQMNNDPALDVANEHAHGHLHHAPYAEQGRVETEYSKGTTYENSNIPSQDSHDQNLHRRHGPNDPEASAQFADAEKGIPSPDRSDEDPRFHRISNGYLQYRVFFHLLIWLLFTGFVDLLHMSCVAPVDIQTPSMSSK